MKKLYFLLFLTVLLSYCKKTEESIPLRPMTVQVYEGLTSSTILWQPIAGYSEPAVEYSIYLNGSLLAGNLKDRTYKITDLKENTTYNGRIEAFADKKKIAEQSFKFTTLQNQPPGEFEIYEISIKNNSLSLRWNQSVDPESSLVVYDVFINDELKSNGLQQQSCEVKNLNPGTTYSGEVAARDTEGNTRKTKFSVKTLTSAKSLLVHKFIEYQGYKRDFAYYIPSSYDSLSNLPLVINLHGAGGNAWDEIGYTYFKTIADRENFILLMPQALLGSFNGETYYQWNAHYIFPWDDVSLLDYLIDFMFTKFNADLSKVYLSGMSNGGFMTFFTARPLQERLAAIAPISGLMSTNVYLNYTLTRPVPLCYMHGTADPIVKIDGSPSATDIIALWTANNNCSSPPLVTYLPDLSTTDNSTVTLYQYYGGTPDSEIQYYKIEGGGHSIPGNETGANMDINAYEVIWTFFKRHSYPNHAQGKIVNVD
jgi:poly(3-hydroxybutyrate) depolymerase